MAVLDSKEDVPRRPTLYEQLESGGLASLASMEGSWGEWADESAPAADKVGRWRGVAVAVILTLAAWFLHRLPVAPFTIKHPTLPHPLGVSMLAMLLGILFGNVVKMPSLSAGCKWVTLWCIPAAVVMMGAKMDFAALAGVGWGIFIAVVGLMALAAVVSAVAGRMLGMSGRASCLLGVGTAVCGSSAILAVAPVNRADDDEVVVSVGVVNLVGLLAMLACCVSLWWLPIDAATYGAWAGATIHAIPQVVAAGETHSAEAAAMATMVKLTRVAMLAPIVLGLALWMARGGAKGKAAEVSFGGLFRYVPWFVWGFVLLAGIRAMGWLPVLEFTTDAGVSRYELADCLGQVSKYLLALAMAAIGLQVQIKPMLRSGSRALAAGVIGWLILSITALLVFRWLVQ